MFKESANKALDDKLNSFEASIPSRSDTDPVIVLQSVPKAEWAQHRNSPIEDLHVEHLFDLLIFFDDLSIDPAKLIVFHYILQTEVVLQINGAKDLFDHIMCLLFLVFHCSVFKTASEAPSRLLSLQILINALDI